MPKHIMIKTAIITLVSSLSFAAYAMADAQRIDVPAGDLTTALALFAKQAEVDLVYRDEQVKGLRTAGVSGNLEPKEAMEKLLAGTPLEVRTDKVSGALLIAPPVTGGGKISGTSERLGDGLHVAEAGAAGSTQPSDPSAAQSGNGSDNSTPKLEEVVVTAQKRKERLQDVPVSIGVLSEADLSKGKVFRVTDVLNQIGGVSVDGTQPGEMSISIRGLVPSAGASTTGYYLDEVPLSYAPTGPFLPDINVFDLSHVEVMRGPQGTLYGVNALGGVVRALTNDADLNNFEAKVRTRVSSTSHGGTDYGGDLAVNVPVVPGKFAIRGVASYSNLSGYIDASTTGRRGINDNQVQSYRLKATYQANDQLSLKISLSRMRLNNGAPSQALDDLTTPISADQPDERVYNIYNLVAEYHWPKVSLLSSTSYLDYDIDTEVGAQVGAFAYDYVQFFPAHAFNQEFRLSSNLIGPWRWSAGAIYSREGDGFVQDVSFLPFPNDHAFATESSALFGELTRSFDGGKLDLTGGVRYFKGRVTRTDKSEFFTGPAVSPPDTAEAEPVTGRVTLAYKPQTNRIVYGSITSGFRNGLPKDGLVAQQYPGFSAVDPDTVISYEAGTKGALWGGKVTYDTAVYYLSWDRIQQSLLVPISGAGGFVATTVNGGLAKGPGIDATVAYRPTSALTLQTAIGWSGLEFAEDVLSSGVSLFSKGDRVNGSPEWTGSVGGSYRIRTPIDGLNTVLSGNYTYRSSLATRTLNGSTVVVEEVDSMRTLAASVALEADRWSLELYGDNLSNERTANTIEDQFRLFIAGRPRPRVIGLQFQYRL